LDLETLRPALDTLFDGAYVVDRDRRFLFWNRAAEGISGYGWNDLAGTACPDGLLCHVDAAGGGLCEGRCPLSRVLADGQPREARVYLHHKEGHRVPVDVRCLPLRDSAGQVTGALEIFRDASGQDDLRQRVDELQRQAFLDPVTGIGNRRHAEQVLHQRLDELDRYGRTFGAILADLDLFKTVNDTHGHEMGDRVLRMVAETLAHNVRPSDFVGRWGGDEFLVVLPRVDRTVLQTAVDRLRALVARSFLTAADRRRVAVSASLGATLARRGETALDVVGRADEQLLASKAAGRDRLAGFE